jgi:ATP-binding cassette subfamily G (WHITE) protein 2 (SNQ2)
VVAVPELLSSYANSLISSSRSHLWRNFGVIIAFTVLYILVTAAASEIFTFVGGGAVALIFKKSKHADKIVKQAEKQDALPADPEKAGNNGMATPARNETLNNENDDEKFHEISKSESVFTWSDVEFTVPYGNGERKLLNKVNGYAKPGVMIALMGVSGAGKTTLLNTLSQRQTTGVVSGSMLVDGRPLGSDFQRNTGFVEQMDLHETTATIREALEFSALLRQERDVPKAEKIAYVDTVINVLELEDIQDAIVSSLGVEQRKRLTIGVELAAKPSLLLFLDEPTTGLDSQSAFSIVRFLKKLSRAGQAIVCTIHQPSSMLVQQFDMILALNPGGNTFYFGPVGDNGAAVVKYFADRGVQCPPGKNVAEFILETAAKGGKREDGKRLNWNREWRESKENQALLEEIARINSTRSQLPAPEATSRHEFATSTSLQTALLTKRLFIAYWRDPSYLYSKLFVSVVIGIFNGFTFWNLSNTLESLQSRLFTSFLIILIPPIIVNGVVPKFYMNRALWEAREHPSRIYNWIAFCTANIVTEIPSAIVGAVIYFLLWYYPTNLPRDSSTAGYVFLMTMLFFIFQASWGQWICAFAPSFTVISNVLPFFFVIFSLFNGVVRPFAQFTPLWKYTLYYLNPATYWIGGVLAATMPDIPVQCAPAEATYFIPPANQSCSSFAGAWVQKAGGYLLDPSSTDQCGWCQYRTGEEYLGTVNLSGKDKWGYFGIFLGFCISNWVLVYFFVYTVRVKGWTFGLGSLFGAMGKGVDTVAGSVTKLVQRREKKGEGKTVEV